LFRVNEFLEFIHNENIRITFDYFPNGAIN